MRFRRATTRLMVVRVLVLSLLVTLGSRLYYLQVLDSHKLTQTATRQHVREVLLPAPRGQIVDDMGRPLAGNRTSLVVSVDRSELVGQSDGGKAVLRRLAPLIGMSPAELSKRITPCAKGVPKPCWNGSPYQPVPVATDTTPRVVLSIAEHREDFRGVSADTETLRQYPNHKLAAHSIGYVGPVTQAELDSAAAAGRTDLHDIDLVGRTGLEKQYDSDLRGTDGVRRVKVDNRGTVVGLDSETASKSGDTLVTSIDKNVQAIAEKAILDQITKSRATFDAKNGRNYAAPSGAAVVMDPRTGRVVALASYPSFDPTEFIGGISQSELNSLTDEQSGIPLVSRATQGQFAPGSTFKLVTASSIVMDGQAKLDGKYSCPGQLKIGNAVKTNFDSESIPGAVGLRQALAKSCDTFFYKFAVDAWNSDQNRIHHGKKAAENQQRMAHAFGFGTQPGIDLPDGQQTGGLIPDRAFKKARWEQNKAQYCGNAKKGYPNVADTARRTFLTALAKENCTDGWRYNLGDSADVAIGQGEITVSPLQLAVAYCALVNGGKIYQPTIGRAIVDPSGKVVRTITPKVRNKVPVRPDVLQFIRDSLSFGKGLGVSGEVAFPGFPLDKAPVGGKTGTAEVFGKQDTSWFAAWTPVNNSRFVVVGMVEQAGLGSRAAAPMAREILDGIYGFNGQKPALPHSTPPTALPKLQTTPAPTPTASGPSPSGTSAPSGSPTQTGTAGPTVGPTAASPGSSPHGFAALPGDTPALPPDGSPRTGPGPR
ncbi:MAG TPA: penicillin-binding protein 2 [Mycobacteriales bacterium]|nr:penicillin-binding protein 2 [Mycobacteriales bacterium]